MAALPSLGADVARISSDISDSWSSVSLAAVTALEFLGAGGQGFWPDPDMLQIGYLGDGGLSMTFHKTELSEDAQYFQVSFWAILPAPLLFSGDLDELDDFTLGLLRNREVNLINQDSLGRFAKQVGGLKEVLAKELDDGTVAIGLFNYDLWEVTQRFKFQDVQDTMGIDLSKGATVRSVWEQKDLGVYQDAFEMDLNACTGTLLKLIPVQ
jgi:alpha-galactosidase